MHPFIEIEINSVVPVISDSMIESGEDSWLCPLVGIVSDWYNTQTIMIVILLFLVK